jgi:hypothetical protein
MSLIYLDKVKTNKAAFAEKVISVSNKLDIDPNWLMAVMYLESSLDHTKVNVTSGATGLIQFLPTTASILGTTTTDLKAMSNIDQMDYVYKYLRQYKSKMNSFVDVYFAVFFPTAIGKYSDYILQSYGLSAEFVASQNSGYDENQDNQLTFREVESKILLMVDPAYRELLMADSVPVVVNWDAERIVKLAIGSVLLFFGGYLLFKFFKK